ncbi:hypothetical protein LTR53_012130 [Teratosphaeriaceae sp. CCFEE 6253]|nr:hypothetical protein LTR53_012130 [Teratosphaeriaceae sp. CCFEE 6253]
MPRAGRRGRTAGGTFDPTPVPISATRPLSRPPPSRPPEGASWQRAGKWWLRHLCPPISHDSHDGPRAWAGHSHQGRRLHKSPPPGHPSRAVTRRPRPPTPPDQQVAPGDLAQGSAPAPAHALSRASSVRSSLFGLGSLLENFKHDIELRFLTPLEREVYHRLTLVTGAGALAHATSPHPSTRTLTLPDRDSADAVAAVQHLTHHFPEHQKDLLCRDLAGLLTSEQWQVLRLAVSGAVAVRCEGVGEHITSPAVPTHSNTAEVEVGVGVAVLRPSPERRVTVIEPARARYSRVGAEQHRFSRGLASAGPRSRSRESLGTSGTQAEPGLRRKAVPMPTDGRLGGECAVPGGWQ